MDAGSLTLDSEEVSSSTAIHIRSLCCGVFPRKAMEQNTQPRESDRLCPVPHWILRFRSDHFPRIWANARPESQCSENFISSTGSSVVQWSNREAD